MSRRSGNNYTGARRAFSDRRRPDRTRSTMATEEQRSITLTVHVTMDARFEEANVADRMLARLAVPLDDGITVDAVTSGDYIALGAHLTERVACPHCSATLDRPLASGLGCTNDWHHLGDRARRQQRREAIRGA